MTKNNNAKKQGAKPKKKENQECMATRAVGGYANPGNRNSLMRTQGPRMVTISNGRGVLIRNTENIGILQSVSTGTTSKGIIMNPAAVGVFPWLSRIAATFSLYRWKKLVISYCPIAPTTLGGSVELAVFYEDKDYNNWLLAAAAAAQNLSTQSQYAFGPLYAGGAIASGSAGIASPSFFGVIPDIDSAHRKVPWFNINTSTTLGADSNTTVACYLAAQCFGGAATAQQVGTLFATYEVELIEPTNPNFA